MKREAEIAQAEADKYRKLNDESRDEIASFEPEREMLENKLQVIIFLFFRDIFSEIFCKYLLATYSKINCR